LKLNLDAKIMKYQPRKKNFLDKFLSEWDIQILIIPSIILLIIFAYLPMWGILSAFQEYDLSKGFFGSPWVGLKQFNMFFHSGEFGRVMGNTLILSFMKLLFGFPAPIILALLLNEIRIVKFKKTVQTITYLPHFISWVIVGGFVSSLLSVEGGTINILLMKLHLINEPVAWLSQPELFWPIIIITNIWKEIGFSAIIYLAAIAGVDPQLYEASALDGATRFQQIYTVTLPTIVPVIITLLILAVGNILNAGFDDLYQLSNNLNNSILLQKADTIDIYAFRQGMRGYLYSYGMAISLFKSVINASMLVAANFISRKISGNSLF